MDLSNRSFRLSKPNRSLLILSSESVSSEYAQIGTYQRISKESMNLLSNDDMNQDVDDYKYRKQSKGLMLLDKLFTLRKKITTSSDMEKKNEEENKDEDEDEQKKKKKKKKRSSWLPDPERRWPLQGW